MRVERVGGGVGEGIGFDVGSDVGSGIGCEVGSFDEQLRQPAHLALADHAALDRRAQRSGTRCVEA